MIRWTGTTRCAEPGSYWLTTQPVEASERPDNLKLCGSVPRDGGALADPVLIRSAWFVLTTAKVVPEFKRVDGGTITRGLVRSL